MAVWAEASSSTRKKRLPGSNTVDTLGGREKQVSWLLSPNVR